MRSQNHAIPRILGILLLCTVLFITACFEDEKKSLSNKTITPISIFKVESRPLSITYHSVGTLISSNTPKIKSRLDGQIEQILVHEGMYVQKGQTLLRIKHRSANLMLEHAKAKLTQANAILHERQADLERANKLIKKGYISQEQQNLNVAQLATAQANLKVAQLELLQAKQKIAHAVVQAPISGLISKISVSKGDYIHSGQLLLLMVNTQQLKAELPFSENKFFYLVKDLPVILKSPAYPKQHINAAITAINPIINPYNRAVNVIVAFQNDYGWTPGSSVIAEVKILHKNAIMIPQLCVIENQHGKYVFIIQNNKAIKRVVETGYQKDGLVEITAGLSIGQQIAQSGVQYLANSSKVKIIGHKK